MSVSISKKRNVSMKINIVASIAVGVVINRPKWPISVVAKIRKRQ